MFDRLLDASILFSFDRSGFERHSRGFDPRDLDVKLEGKLALVTGANSGLGLAAARELAARGAELVLLCRNADRAEEARAELVSETGNPNIAVELVDLSSLASVRAFSERFERDRVDILVHNAGLLPDERIETEDGLEFTFATHVVGPYLLTRLLEPKLAAAQDARVVFVSSGGMYAERLSLKDIAWKERAYDGVRAYAQTKRMQVVLTELLAEELDGGSIHVHAMHPGWADTPGVEKSLPRFWELLKNRLRTPEQGADTIVWLAVSEEAGRSTGRFWLDRGEARTHLLPTTLEEQGDRQALLSACRRIAAGEDPGEVLRPEATWTVRVLYDGDCPLCSREIAGLRRLDRGRGAIDFEDIAEGGFDPARYGVTHETLMARIHGALPDGTLIEGMEVFRRAYAAVGLGWLLAPTRWPGLSGAANAGYRWFARNRLRLTGRPQECESDRCEHVADAASELRR